MQDTSTGFQTLGATHGLEAHHTRGVGSNSHILLVENDRDLRTVVRMLLERAGHQVVEARDGYEALQLLGGRRFDLVIADTRMPAIGGRELATRLRSNPRTVSVPILMMSGDSNIDQADSGADALLRKPFEVADLLSSVSRLTTPPKH